MFPWLFNVCMKWVVGVVYSTGLRQGCEMFPWLFNVCMKWVVGEVYSTGLRQGCEMFPWLFNVCMKWVVGEVCSETQENRTNIRVRDQENSGSAGAGGRHDVDGWSAEQLHCYGRRAELYEWKKIDWQVKCNNPRVHSHYAYHAPYRSNSLALNHSLYFWTSYSLWWILRIQLFFFYSQFLGYSVPFLMCSSDVFKKILAYQTWL